MTSLSGTNSIPIAAGGTASVPSAANSISQHTASYLPTSASLSAPGTHIPTAAYHLTHGSASTSQPALALQSHSQGPTPASTPPTVPNETKGPGQYQNYTHTMNQHPLPYGRLPSTGVIINNNATRTQHPASRIQQMTRFMNPLSTGGHPMGYQINMLQSAVPLPGNASAANMIPAQNYQIPGSGAAEHNILYMSSAAPYSTFYNSSSVRPAWTTSSTRTAAQNVVQVGQTNAIIAGSQSYLSMNPVATMPQQQPQQQHTPATASTRPRSRALPIIDPATGAEVDVTDSKESAKPDKKDGAAEMKRVTISSSSYSSSTPSSTAFAGKEQQNQSVLNGTTPSAPYVPSTNDWKATPQTGAATSTFGQVDATVTSMKAANVPTSIQSSKMDYKKPTREEHPTGDAQPGDSKLRDKQATSSWPETSAGVPPPTIATSAQRGLAPAGSKKSSKEAEGAVSNSSVTAPVSIVPPPTTTTTPPATTMILTSTVPSDGVNKTIVTTPTAVGLNDSDTGSKKTTKQGIQGGGGIVGVPKDGILSMKHASGKPPAAVVVPAAAPSQSLPETIQIIGSSTAAQNIASVTKSDSKSQPSVQQQHATAQPASGVAAAAAAIPGAKPPATAMPTSGGPFSEKITATVTLSGEPKSIGSVATAAAAEKQPSSLTSSSSVKDEKPSPSTKPKNRGKDQQSSDAASANDQSSSNAKGNKSAQSSVPAAKHHGVDVAANKPVAASAPSGSVAAKQINGEAVEQNASSEGKTKKKKGSSKKELNKKGQEKEGSDMDIFTKIEQTATLPEKGVRVEKVSQPPNSQPLAVNAAANTNNRSKINSSQKSESVSSVNSLDGREKVIDSQNIPIASTVPAQITDTNKTENDKPIDNNVVEKKKYSVKFLYSLAHQPQCWVAVKVNYSPVLLASQGGSGSRGMSQNGYASGGANFLPSFMSPGNSSSLAPRKSQQGSMRREKPNQIHVSLSLREEVPLRRSKDAWKPAIFTNEPKNVNDEEKKTEALYKTARGILNKLTPEKFPTLVERFKSLDIDTRERLRGIIDLIFEKAVDEPGFCKWYAEICNVMQTFSVPNEPDPKQFSFRAVLLNKCQNHFESAKAEELDADKKRAEINACTDPEKRKELQLVAAENERKTRRKSVGNCRFIGELFKLKMLTPKIMLSCIRILISQLEEESLECLCKLLTTIGKDIDEKLPKELDANFKRLQEIADPRKTQKISSRIRFMILDVIDLRRNKWVPRRETDNPKTIDQMNMEMEKKEQEQKFANMTIRKMYDDYNNSNRNKDSRRGNRNDNQSDDNNWKTVTSKNSTSKPNYKYDAQKLANITSGEDEGISLGRPSSLNMWRMGSNMKPSEKKSVAPSPMGGERMDSSRSSSVTSSRNASGGKLTPSTSLERSKQNLPPRDDDTNKMSRSGSVQNVHPVSRESSTQRAPPSRNASQTAPAPSPSISPLPAEQARKFSETIFKEYVNNQSIQDTIIDFTDRFKTREDKQVAVEVFIEQVLEKPDHHTHPCGKIVTALLEAKVLSVPIIVEAASTCLQLADDLIVDYPKFWDYMANLMSEWPLLYEDCKLFNELKTVLQRLPQRQDCSAVLSRMEKTIRNNKGRIFEYFTRALDAEDCDSVFKWINENVDNPNNNENLVIALTEAVCKAVLDKKAASNEDVPLKDKYGRYFKKYIDNKEQLELTCLNTIVSFSRRKEHPQGLLLNMFEGLYDSKALSVDSFLQLENSQSEEIGVVMMNVKNFYDYLKQEAPDEQ